MGSENAEMVEGLPSKAAEFSSRLWLINARLAAAYEVDDFIAVAGLDGG